MDGKICIAPVAKSPESGKNAMAAERKLKVSFDEPERGWIAITMSAKVEQP